MKKTTLLFAALATMFLFTGCSDKSSRQHKVQSQGAAYEVIVVCSGATWDGQAGDTLRSIMLRPVDMLNQKEPQFDVLRFSPDGFTGLTQRHRNILVLNVGEKYEEPSIRTVTDVYASPQLIVQVDAPSQAAMTALLDTSRNDIVRYFETAERLRDTENAVRFGEKAIDKVIGETFGISLNIPSGYKIRNAQQDFMWISYEMPTSSQGIIIYAYPYTGKQDFTEESIVARRNEFVKRIPGPSEGSYMTTVEDAATIEYKKINDTSWAEVRGFWDVAGDFMGGPFTSFSTLDTSSGNVICLDFYVYSPQLPKRNYMRALEHIVYSYSQSAE